MILARSLLVLLCAALALSCRLPTAQAQGVLQSGMVSPGHAAMWSTNGVIMDAGSTSFPSVLNTRLSGLGIINPANTDCRWNTYSSPYSQFCLGFDANGNALLSYQNIGGPQTGNIKYDINGITGTIGSPSFLVNTPGTVVDVRQYGVVGGGIYRTDGEIDGGSSTGTCDLYSTGYAFGSANPIPIGQYAVVFGAGSAGETLAGGIITAVNGNHATITNCASTAVSANASFYVCPDDFVGINAAVNNANGYSIKFPSGIFCTSQQIIQAPQVTNSGTFPSLNTILGDGPSQTILVPVISLSDPVLERNTTTASGGGWRDFGIDAAGLATIGALWAGGDGHGSGTGSGTLGAIVFDVMVKNATITDWQCGDGITSIGMNDTLFYRIAGETDSTLFTAAQRALYNFYIPSGGTGECSDTDVAFSRFANAQTANIYDGSAEPGNRYLYDHPFNTPSTYLPSYMIQVKGGDQIVGNQLDTGTTVADIYATGNDNVIMGNIGTHWTSGDGYLVQLASGVLNTWVTGNYERSGDDMPAADVIVALGNPGAGTIVTNNPGASYQYPVVSQAQAAPSSTSAGCTNTGSYTMLGLAGTITPAITGNVTFAISGNAFNSTAANGESLQISYGTGTAPTNNHAVTGTQIGAAQAMGTGTSTLPNTFSLQAGVTGLTPGTAYWYDLACKAITGGGGETVGLSLTANEAAPQ